MFLVSLILTIFFHFQVSSNAESCIEPLKIIDVPLPALYADRNSGLLYSNSFWMLKKILKRLTRRDPQFNLSENGVWALNYFSPKMSQRTLQLSLSVTEARLIYFHSEKRLILPIHINPASNEELVEITQLWLKGKIPKAQATHQNKPKSQDPNQPMTASQAQKAGAYYRMFMIELNRFLIKENREPSTSLKAPPKERSLANRFKHLKSKYGDHWTLLARGTVLKELERLKPRKLPYTSPQQRIEQINSFIEAEERLPSSASKNEYEASLGEWLTGFKIDNSEEWYKKLNPRAQEILLEKELTGRLVKTAEERLEDLSIFIIVNKDKILPNSKAAEPEEKSLGQWLVYYKKRNKENWWRGLWPEAQQILMKNKLLSRGAHISRQ